MKCPYRKTLFDLKQVGLEGAEEEFAECYGEDCPFFFSAKLVGDRDYCRRAEAECRK